jgi:hypothetical protein
MFENGFLDPDQQATNGGAIGNPNENLVLNLDDVNEDMPVFEALPPGVYNCIVENAEFSTSSKGNPMITWVFKVVDPEYVGRLLFFHTVLNNETGLARLKRTLVRVVPDVSLRDFNPREFCDEGRALGFPCRVKVRIKPYQGQRRNDVVDVLAAAQSEGAFLDESFE